MGIIDYQKQYDESKKGKTPVRKNVTLPNVKVYGVNGLQTPGLPNNNPALSGSINGLDTNQLDNPSVSVSGRRQQPLPYEAAPKLTGTIEGLQVPVPVVESGQRVSRNASQRNLAQPDAMPSQANGASAGQGAGDPSLDRKIYNKTDTDPRVSRGASQRGMAVSDAMPAQPAADRPLTTPNVFQQRTYYYPNDPQKVSRNASQRSLASPDAMPMQAPASRPLTSAENPTLNVIQDAEPRVSRNASQRSIPQPDAMPQQAPASAPLTSPEVYDMPYRKRDSISMDGVGLPAEQYSTDNMFPTGADITGINTGLSRAYNEQLNRERLESEEGHPENLDGSSDFATQRGAYYDAPMDRRNIQQMEAQGLPNEKLQGSFDGLDARPDRRDIQNLEREQKGLPTEKTPLQGHLDIPNLYNGKKGDTVPKEWGHIDGIEPEINAQVAKDWRDYVAKKDEEAEEKDNRRRLAILAIGDALRHMGNLYYTNKGATPQQFNDPVTEEYNRQKADKKEKQAAELAREQREAKQRQQDIENARKDKELSLKGDEINIKKGNLAINAGKADAYNKTQESIQAKNKADEGRIKASADNIAQQARLNGVKADKQGALMDSQTNANNARAAKSRSGIAVDASTIAKNEAATAKAWQEVGQGQSGVKVKSYYGQLTRNRKAAPTSDQVANMYNRLSKSGLIDNGTQSDIAAILAKGESSETTQKQMNAIQKALAQGTPKQRQLVAHELIDAGWYQTTTSAQKRQIATAKANAAKGATTTHKAQPTSVRGKKRGGTKATTTAKPQAKSSKGVV